MTDDSKQGTGDELGRVDLGCIGTLVIDDDACSDPDVNAHIVQDGGAHRSPHMGFRLAREEHGDEAVCKALDGATVTASSPSMDNFEIAGPFICDGCGKTWPSKHNQTPDGPKDFCPDCHDE